MLLPRLLTAVIGIPVILIAIKFGGIPYLVLVTGIILFALNEYFFLLKYGKYNAHPVPAYVMSVMLLSSIYISGAKLIPAMDGFSTSVVFSAGLILFFLFEIITGNPRGSMGRIGVSVFGVFAVCWTLSHLLLIRDMRPKGEYYTYYLFFLIWIVDTAAYGFGMKLGRHRLAEKISPKKSIEGAIGGFLTGIIVSILLRQIFGLYEFTVSEIAIVGLIITALAYLSDLAESLIKRDVGLKDSDVLLPGHGGILDRFDSFLLTAPLFYYYLMIFRK